MGKQMSVEGVVGLVAASIVTTRPQQPQLLAGKAYMFM